MENPDTENKGMVREIVWGSIRHLKTIDWIISLYAKDFSKIKYDVKNILRIGVFQLIFMKSKVPAYASINETVKLSRELKLGGFSKFINALLREVQRNMDNIKYPSENNNFAEYCSIKYSYPLWLTEKWIKNFGDCEAEKMLIANNKNASINIRVNKSSMSREDLKKALIEDSVECRDIEGTSYGIELMEFPVLENLKAYKDNAFIIQDGASQIIPEILDAKENENILDACSGTGAKTSLIALLADFKSKITAIDNSPDKINFLNKLNIKNTDALCADTVNYKGGPFDKILLDAPCSGFGVIRRKPDIKWNRTKSDIENKYPDIQFKMLENLSGLLKKNGVLVYAACSAEREENEDVVEKFLDEYRNFKLLSISSSAALKRFLFNEDRYFKTRPHVDGLDGFFACKIMRCS